MQKLGAVLLAFSTLIALAKDYRILDSQETKELRDQVTSVYARKALDLKATINKKNAEDLLHAFELAQKTFNAADMTTRTEMINTTVAGIEKDRLKLEALQAVVATTKFDTIKYAPFKTSLAKMGASNGYLAAAVNVLRQYSTGNALDAVYFMNRPTHEQTANKLALIYLAKFSAAKSVLPFAKMKMLYPADVPPQVTINDENLTDWFEKKDDGSFRFNVINVGYVYGGEMQKEICTGIDCSSFVSYTTEAQKRLSTMVMEFTARELGVGTPLATEAEQKLKEDFLVNWGMREALEDYRALPANDTKDLNEGDIVVWRWNVTNPTTQKTFRTGHAAMVIKITDGNHFIALEANREDDKSLDGVMLTERLLKKEGADIYILRRK